ncbi:MAG: phenylalanine--tRNA ligase subunit alpha [Candidatus Woesearchaeota archaeon]|nr:phenylalanine--tRNA ligase subunit alpha [Candidatus Woesearchaeota archaeon]
MKTDASTEDIKEIKKILGQLHLFERKVLPILAEHETLGIEQLAKIANLGETETVRALQWLSNKELVTLTSSEREMAELDSNGRLYTKKGLPEKRFLAALTEAEKKKKELTLTDIPEAAGLTKEEVQVCIGLLKKKGAIELKPGLKLTITPNGKKLGTQETIEETFLKKLEHGKDIAQFTPDEKGFYEQFKQRKFVIKTILRKDKTTTLTALGKTVAQADAVLGITKQAVVDRLTSEAITQGTWKKKNFRGYDVAINVPTISGGKKHFVTQSTEYIKKIWLDLGFKEMTGNYVQTSFWNLDALFIPQDHPARLMQDTFFIGQETFTRGKLPPISEKVKAVHEHGGTTGSKGWQAPWSPEEAMKVLLRTHTTVLSALKLSQLKKQDLPAKFFAVGKVFRNEALDWKHLFEFHQVDGIVIDPDANLKHLKGYLKLFFRKMGFPDARIRPAHFPYTEPSCEVDVWHPVKKEWIELGGAGIFRPEVVVPLLGEDIPVLAWGLGLERIIADYYQFTDIRDLYANDIKKLRNVKVWMK